MVLGQPFVKLFALCYQTIVCLSCPFCLFVLSAALVYCGQTVRWIKMKFCTQVGPRPRPWPHCVRWEPSSPSPKSGRSPRQFSAHICCRQMAGWIKMPLGMEVNLGPGDFVLDGDPGPRSPKRGRNPTIFGPCLLWRNGWMDQDGTWHGGGPRSSHIVLHGDPAPRPKGG